MNIERMNELLRVLDEIKDEINTIGSDKQFDISEWLKFNNECGTVGCAIGYASIDPWFNDHGFKLNEIILSERPHYVPIYKNKNDITFSGFTAVSEFFDISLDDTYKLFDNVEGYEYITIDDIIEKVENFIYERVNSIINTGD